MAEQVPWVNYIDGLAQQFEAHQEVQADEEERCEKEFYKILRDTCNVVHDAEKAASPDLPAVVEKAHALFSNAIGWALAEDLYEFIPCFSDSKEEPEVEDSLKMCGSDITEAFMEFYTGYLNPGAPRPKLPKFARTTSWAKSPRPHPYSTRLSRFRDDFTSPASDATPLAQQIYQARAQLSIDFASLWAMEISSGGSILAMSRGGGWKSRDPILRYYRLDDVDDEWLEGQSIEPGLSNVAHYITTDEERKLIFLADDDRIKSFSWATNEDDKPKARLPNIHTMNSLRDFNGPITLLPNGRLLRVGEGQAAIWTLDTLETHQDNPGKLIGEGQLNTDNSWREAGCKRIEMSSGTRPHSIVAFADAPAFAPRTLHVHAPSGHLLCGERDGGAGACAAIDVEHGGRIVARYLGHGRDVERIVTSAGDANVFVTAGGDGFARVFDVRRPLPVMTFNTGQQSEGCPDVVFIHPDGIPTLFTGGERTEQVKVWDVRAKSVVYELSTGNNAVTAMAWDARHSSLFVATECQTRTRMGGLGGYRKARVPRWATWKAAQKEAQALREGRGAGDVSDEAGDAPVDEPAVAVQAELQGATSADAAVLEETPTPQEDVKDVVVQNSIQAPVAEHTDTDDARRDVVMVGADEDGGEDDDGDDSDWMDEDDDSGGLDEDEDEDEGESEGTKVESSSEDEEPEDIDEEYSADTRWPRSCFHKEDFYGYTFDAGRNILMRWQFKEEPNLKQLPPRGP